MRATELKVALDKLGIDERHYSIGGPDYGDQIRIELTDRWHVFYSERGGKYDERVFDEEEEACNYFYQWVKSCCAPRQ